MEGGRQTPPALGTDGNLGPGSQDRKRWGAGLTGGGREADQSGRCGRAAGWGESAVLVHCAPGSASPPAWTLRKLHVGRLDTRYLPWKTHRGQVLSVRLEIEVRRGEVSRPGAVPSGVRSPRSSLRTVRDRAVVLRRFPSLRAQVPSAYFVCKLKSTVSCVLQLAC